MSIAFVPQIALLAAAGVLAGLWLLVRGMAGYRDATRLGDTATSRIATLAAGEVQVSGVIEPAELTLVSPLQSAPCVYYRSTIDDGRRRTGPRRRVRARSGRSVSACAMPRATSGSSRVARAGMPRCISTRPPASWAMSHRDCACARARPSPRRALAAKPRSRRSLRSRPRGPAHSRSWPAALGACAAPDPGGVIATARRSSCRAMPSRSSAERCRSSTSPIRPRRTWRSGPGSPRTTRRWPATSPRPARPASSSDSAEEAWGNAAIPGFGIGRPVRPPELDAAANALPIASADGGRPTRTKVHDRTRDPCACQRARRPFAHRPRPAERRGRAAAGSVPDRAARGRPRDRVRDRARADGTGRARVVSG